MVRWLKLDLRLLEVGYGRTPFETIESCIDGSPRAVYTTRVKPSTYATAWDRVEFPRTHFPTPTQPTKFYVLPRNVGNAALERFS